MPLTLQDKLALALTSAGSQRKLAALVGVSHQKIGRWLREGEAGGARQIPPEARAAIDLSFKIHKDVTRSQARIDRLPFNADAPVYINRPLLRDGRPGERVYAEHTQFIKPDLRQAFIGSMQQSKQFLQVSVRSLINLYTYIKAKLTDQTLAPKARDKINRRLARLDGLISKDSLASSFMQREAENPGSNAVAPLYTKYENIAAGTRAGQSLKGVESKLRQKHEPHTGTQNPGTVLADQFLFQTNPGQYDKQKNSNSGKKARIKLIRR